MTKRGNEEQDLIDYAETLASTILTEVFSMIAQERKERGEEFSTSIVLTILASTVCTAIYDQLYLDRKAKVSHELATERYAELKDGIQNAIATGFAEAMTSFTGKYTDYYCQVSLVPKSLNQKPC